MISILLFALITCKGHGGDFDDIDDPTNQEIANAFLLALGAGLSTVVGAAGAFLLREEDVAKEQSTFLAGCLAFAAAVMVYVSFIEIWPESLEHYGDVADDDQVAHVYTSLTFFGGIGIGLLCSKIVGYFEQRHTTAVATRKVQNVEMQSKAGDNQGEDSQSSAVKVLLQPDAQDRRAELLRTGLVTAVSIALHNFPEGLVTFLAALSDWHVGVATAFAIAMHNIPEGISIAIPYYYASESRWKAFALAFLSGVAEPIGALIGWAIVNDIWGHAAFGVMFGVTAGIMIYISFTELLPLARKNDPTDKVTTVLIFLGFFVMDLSLFVAE